MSQFFLWGGLTLYVALAPIQLGPLSLAGWFMLAGVILLVFKK